MLRTCVKKSPKVCAPTNCQPRKNIVAPLVQLDRMLVYGTNGRRFESCTGCMHACIACKARRARKTPSGGGSHCLCASTKMLRGHYFGHTNFAGSAWCSGYHICLTRRRSPVQSRALISSATIFPALENIHPPESQRLQKKGRPQGARTATRTAVL